MTRRGWIALALLALVGSAAGTAGTAWWVAARWSRATPRRVGPPPPDLGAREVEFATRSGRRLRGWFAPGDDGAGTVALLHGVREDRRSMLGRARFLRLSGYSVLLFDLQSHGESEGDGVTLGRGEAADARAAVDFLAAERPGAPRAAIGFSLGGAACLLGPDPLPVDALVLEAVYPDIETAVANRLRLRAGAVGAWLAPLLVWQLEPLWGIDPADLRPVDAVRRARAPLLLIAGESDPRTTVADAERLLAAAPEPKELWVVPGAGHVDFHRHARMEYEARVLDFLDRYLPRPGSAPSGRDGDALHG